MQPLVKSPPFVNALAKHVNERPFLLRKYSGSEYIICLAEDFPFRHTIIGAIHPLRSNPTLSWFVLSPIVNILLDKINRL